MALLTDAAAYARFLGGLGGHARRRLTLDEARAIVRRRLAEREERFLATVRGVVYDNPRSPYLPLLRRAGCTFADLERGVRSDGIEATLRALRDAGVFVGFEEYKGLRPIVRGDLELRPSAADFRIPGPGAYYHGSTGGSTGVPRAVHRELAELHARAPRRMVADHAHGFLGTPTAVWASGSPGYGLSSMLVRMPWDGVPVRWFTPTGTGDHRPELHHRMQDLGIRAALRARGVRIPRPEPVPYDEAVTVARWMASTLEEHGRCGLRAAVSLALRVAVAAREEGIDLSGAVVAGGGEPPTPAKVGAIEATGASFVASYHFSEVGAIGHGCVAGDSADDQHFAADHLALIQRSRTVPGHGVEVPAFLLTTLLPSARAVLLNVESDDFGTVTQRSCGCPLGELGMTTHLGGVRSFRKLTGEGVTLIGSEVERILETVLPARFGGTPLDYQLAEEEDADGFTRISIVVSPRVEIEDEARVVETFLEGLRAGGEEARLSRINWAQSETLRVRRREPATTAAGKVPPLAFGGRS